MKNKIILGIAFVFMLLITISGALAALSNDQFTYWTFDDSDTSGGVSVDIAKGKNLTITSATTGIVGIIGEAYSFDGSSDSLTRADSSLSFGDDFTIQFWMNFTTGAVNDVILSMDDAGDAPSPYRIQFDSCSTSTTCKLKIGIIDDGSTTHTVTNIGEVGGGNFQAGNWYHVIFAFNDTTDIMKTYVDGTLVNTSDLGSFTLDSAGTNLYIARYGGAGFLYEGVLDEMALWNRTLTDNDASNLYNSGQGNQYPYDLNKLTDIQITPNLPGTTDNIIANTTYTSQTNLNANITAKWLNGTTIIKQTTFNNTGNGTTLNYSINCVDFEACKLGNTLTISFNATNSQANSFKTKNVAIGLNLTVNATNAKVGGALSGFQVTVDGQSKNATGTSTSFLLNSGSYNVTVSKEDYSTETVETTVENATQTLNVPLYPDPSSVRVTVKDEETNTVITSENITLTVGNTLGETVYTITNGTQFVGNLSPDNYTFKFTSTSYSARSYLVTVGEDTTQTLTAFLASTNSTVIFNAITSSTLVPLPETLIVMERSVNGTYTPVESRETDITGRVQFSFIIGESYRFTASKTGYQTRTFTLDPILFTEYQIPMEEIGTTEETEDYSGVNVYYNPKITFVPEDATQQFNFTFISPGGSLTSYFVNAVYPGGTDSDSGSNAGGGTLTITVNPTNADFGDKINITYGYETTTSGSKNFTTSLGILLLSAQNNTFAGNINKTYEGLGDFERITMTTAAAMGAGGVGSLVGGASGGILGILIVMGYAAYANVINPWAVVITMIAGVIILMGRGGR